MRWLADAAIQSPGSSLERWAILLALLVAILTLVGMIFRTGRNIASHIARQIDATRANTDAIGDLSSRVTHLEGRLTP